MSSALDVVVVGGGVIGLASAWALARRGAKVQVLERFDHVHDRGSHGGGTRLLRHAYHEGADYVRLVARSDREWVAMSERIGKPLLIRSGLLELGPPEHPMFVDAIAALREHAIPHSLLEAATVRDRYPFWMPDDWVGCLSPNCGYLLVQACMDGFRDEARAAGASVRYQARVREIAVAGERPRVLLQDGTVISADRIVVAAGSYASALLPGVERSLGRAPLEILRRVLAWSAPISSEADAALSAMPAWACFAPEGLFYGFPANAEGTGCKLAVHIPRRPQFDWMYEAQDPETVDRSAHERDLAPLREFLTRYMPSAAGEFVRTMACVYANTETEDFWIDEHPADPRVTIAAGFSGHGFKFAPVIGLAVAERMLDGSSDLWLPRFRGLPRFGGRSTRT